MEVAAAAKTVDGVVEEIMRIHKSLPPRPGIEEVEAAKTLILNVEREDQLRLEAIAKQTRSQGVPEELFCILQEMQKNLVHFQSKEQKREALELLDLDHFHSVFDDLIQRASQCVSDHGGSGGNSRKSTASMASTSISVSTSTGFANGSSGLKSSTTSDFNSWSSNSTSFYFEKEPVLKSPDLFTRDDSYVQKAKFTFDVDGIRSSVGLASALPPLPQILESSLKPVSSSSAQDGEKLSLIKLASLIEVSSKKGTRDLNLRGVLMDQIEWLPDSVGKLSSLITLDLSENRIAALPVTIGGLSSLTKLDLHANRIIELPESIGDLLNLEYLDLRGNQLARLPPTVGRLVHLEELDLSSNRLSLLPDTIGSLVSLKKLNVETNDIEELPHTIGQCTSLRELHVDYSKLKALPEAVGRIESLEILSVRYNNIRMLPTTMSSLSKLRELDVSFNELESVPESLCLATSLVKLNIGNNFAVLRSLPRSIGNLEMLEELDISNNQIHVLPESFRLLTRLRVLRVEENPLEVPPRHVAEKGAQAVVQYMADLHANKDVQVQPLRQKKSWLQICCFPKSNKRKRNGFVENTA
ncbi:Plant intracellular Ras-group- LRR protein 4 [Ancistrocladus abbreviatus]